MTLDEEEASLGRREAQKRERRRLIVETATRCFLANGYAGTTMSTVFNELGGSRSTLYGYFSSKDELFQAVIEAALETYRQDFQTILQPHEPLDKTLRAFCRSFIRRIAAPDGIALRCLIQDVARQSPHIGALFYERGPRTTYALLATYFAYHIERGTLRCKDPQQAALLLASLCVGGLGERALWGVERPTEAAIQAEAAAIVRQFLSLYQSAEVAERAG